MKIETEVHNNSVFQFKCNGVGRPTAQDSKLKSIARPADQQQQQDQPVNGCGSENGDSTTVHIVFPLSSAFDCEHFQFIDDEEEGGSDDASEEGPERVEQQAGEVPPPPSFKDIVLNGKREDKESEMNEKDQQLQQQEIKKELKSLLKRSGVKTGHKNRVKFDEAVTLYSDENDDIQLLALTTGPEIIFTEVYYMFEPPIEYQDIPPFEPPAEYQDVPPPAPEGGKPQTFNNVPNEIPYQLSVNNVTSTKPSKEPPSQEPEQKLLIKEEEMAAERTELLPVEENSLDQAPEETAKVNHDTGESDLNENTGPVQSEESTKESDELLERFLDVEREFAVDEELNSVFQELDSEFVNDNSSSTLDDNFFRKLITLLSSAEGDITARKPDDVFSNNLIDSIDETCQEAEEDDNSQNRSRTLSEADSDCSISSQDTIIVRLGEDDIDRNSREVNGELPTKPERAANDDGIPNVKKAIAIFNEKMSQQPEEKPRPLPRESLLNRTLQSQAVARFEKENGESFSRQSSGEQSVNSSNSQEHPQDADDSTSSDSRSGEVEAEIKLDDIGYDEEDAEDYDEESFRGMAHGNSKIRRIIKKNALQCTLLKGIEAKRRQQPNIKYPRPKSPLLSQESIVEKLKWLTTGDEHKDPNRALNFHSKPPDVILSTGGAPVNGSIPNSAPSEADVVNQAYMQSQLYPMQRFPRPSNSMGYYARPDGYPVIQHPSLPRQRMPHSSQVPLHSYTQNQAASPQAPAQAQWTDQKPEGSMTVPRNFRDWRVIQKFMGRSSDKGQRSSQIPADYVRNSSSNTSGYPSQVPPDVSRTSQPRGTKDELERFVEQDSKRLERIKKRYSVAEEDDDDPTFGFARRPIVKGVQTRIQPSELVQNSAKLEPYILFEEPVPQAGGPMMHQRGYGNAGTWNNRDPSFRQDMSQSQTLNHYRSQQQTPPMHVHRASVALTELPGNATIPYPHRKPIPDPRYHSYAESMYGSTRTLPTKGWAPPLNGSPALNMSPGPMLQVPTSNDERGVPEGASSSPKLSTDSLYHAPMSDPMAAGGAHKEEGMIFYSMNV